MASTEVQIIEQPSMTSHPQKQARIRMRTKMARLDMSVTVLAKRLGHDISVVSKAINHGRFPRVVCKIKEALGE